MRFLVDECVGPAVASWLRGLGHHVLSIFDDCRGFDDERIIDMAWNDNFVLITNDKGFGSLVYRSGKRHHGLIMLRLSDEQSANKIKVLSRLLDQHSASIENNFIVASEQLIRISKQKLDSY